MITTETITNGIMQVFLLLTIYIFSNTHIINNLVIIEFTVITIIMSLFNIITFLEIENYIILYFIIIIICESIVGLSILIALIRTHSNDYLKSTNIIQF